MRGASLLRTSYGRLSKIYNNRKGKQSEQQAYVFKCRFYLEHCSILSSTVVWLPIS